MSFQSTLSQLLGFLALTLSWGIPLPSKAAAQAAPLPLESGIQKQVSAPAPAPLVKWLQEQIEAANRRDLEEVMAGYSPDFRHRDGLDRQGVERAIRKLWEAHPQLTYAAEILSWRRLGPEIVAEIASQVQGSQSSGRGEFQVQASALVRNRYRPNAAKPEQLLLVEQEVLREASTLTSGSAPPTVTFRLPEVVKPGSPYSLQAIVAEPLAQSLLLGAVEEQPVAAAGYLDLTSFALEPLQAGGLFLQADAPPEAGARWLSVMLVNQSGLVVESRRLVIQP
ncbi:MULTISPECIES: nuclear transport factor 2 family protein [unclassified Synechococcus]|uniref:nuclear transport factor 2 family protein n=1 Tax=unclassified Synechococcus TaxID=2626047 RepID=UPI000C1A01D2|nr:MULTISPECIES: nuclear transport factor 2 family protein [unclassified Synechococcus]